ncbi:MFS transporter [Silvanigrella aquatica]|nr:MFS transporter [Silvanigrella aquatica]
MKKKHHHILFLIFLVLFEFAVYLSNDMILPALVDVVKEFNHTDALIPLSLSIFLFGSLSIQLLVGPLSDQYGRRITMFAGGFLVLVGNVLGMYATDMLEFFIARILQGMGPCFIGVAGYACVHELYDEKEAIHVISWMASVALFAPMLGPFLGSLVILFAGWRFIFMSTFLLAFIGLVGLWFTMPETLTKNKSVKMKLNLIFHNYLDLLKNRKFTFGSISFGFSFGAIMIWIASSPIILIHLLGLNKTEFGLIQIPVFLSFILGTFLLRYISKSFSSMNCLFIGFTITFVGSCLSVLFSLLNPQSLLLLIISISIFNLGYGILSAPFMRIILDSTRQSKGIASALSAFIYFTIAIAASAAFGLIYSVSLISFTLYIFVTLILSGISLLFMKPFKKLK